MSHISTQRVLLSPVNRATKSCWYPPSCRQVPPFQDKHAPCVLSYPRAIHVGYREPPPGSGQCTFEWARGRLFDKNMAEMFFEVGALGEEHRAHSHELTIMFQYHDSRSLIQQLTFPTPAQICEEAGTAVVMAVRGQTRTRQAPAPLSTLEMQKRATAKLRLSGGLPGYSCNSDENGSPKCPFPRMHMRETHQGMRLKQGPARSCVS